MIMRIFIRLRQILIDNTELKQEVERIRTQLDVQDITKSRIIMRLVIF